MRTLKVFLLELETIPEISELTGMSEALLTNIYYHDKEWGIVSKIYVVEKEDNASRTETTPSQGPGEAG